MNCWAQLAMISSSHIEQALAAITRVDGIYFDERFLVQDIVGLAEVFTNPHEFDSAIAATVRILELVVAGKVDTNSLGADFEGWERCHYQPIVAQGGRATMRIMFVREGQVVRVRDFGDRRLPDDFYRRMAEIGRLEQGSAHD